MPLAEILRWLRRLMRVIVSREYGKCFAQRRQTLYVSPSLVKARLSCLWRQPKSQSQIVLAMGTNLPLTWMGP